jgi:hypothetical protein
MKKHIVLWACLMVFAISLSAQEQMLPLQTNPALKYARQNPPMLKSSSALQLPFFDDFSYYSVYPDSSKWVDRFTFVNNTFGPLPPTWGMVTLDAIDDTGAVYTWATPTPFQADYLTSQPLRLDSVLSGIPQALDQSDSVYFSFYYQPQGYGNYPNPYDSLILEFYAPDSNEWYEVWGSAGLSYSDFFDQYHRSFRQVILPVTDSKYFADGFQFRFRNYASIANSNLPSWQSNMDMWNLDYVYLNYNRNKYDTAYADVAMVTSTPSLLKNYTAMPARQYTAGELKDTLKNVITNLNNTANSISYRYTIDELGGGFTHTYLGGDYNILPYNTNGYHNWSFHTSPAVDFALPAMSSDSVVFEVTHQLGINGWADAHNSNDTLRFLQKFYNYYAYDDGSAEAGYGLAGTGSRLAYQFTLNTPDTLGAIQMFFNQTYTTPAARYFYLMVWQSLEPEVVLYKSKRVRPYPGDSLNQYHTYFISDSIIKLSGTFYIGWQQVTEEVLNVGYDINNNASSKVKFNAMGTWENTVYQGAPMIRPVMGTAGQNKKHDGLWFSNDLVINIFPNPSNKGKIYISLPGKYQNMDPENTMTVEIFNYMGRKVKEVPYSNEINVEDLSQGYYLLRLNSYSSSESVVKSFLITR